MALFIVLCVYVFHHRPFGAMTRVFLQKHHTGMYNNGGYGFVEYASVEDAKVRWLGVIMATIGSSLFSKMFRRI